MKNKYKDYFEPYFKAASLPVINGDKPLVSILTAHFNNTEYLNDFINSILAQTYQNWELLFVDDCSPNGGAESILQEYNDNRIKFYKMPQNSGGGAARTEAFKKSIGNFIIYFDSDDIMHPWYIQSLMAKALAPTSPDIVMFDYIGFGDSIPPYLGKSKVKTEKDLTISNWLIGQSLVKRKLWEVTGGQSLAPEIRYGSQDWEFWLHAFKKCSPLNVVHTELPLMLYRQHTASISRKSPYHEHIIRRYILSKHSSLFIRHQTGKIFLTEGYEMALFANLGKRDWKKAASIFVDGLYQECRIPFFIKICKRLSLALYKRLMCHLW